MIRWLLMVLCCLLTVIAQAADPVAPVGLQVIHGTFQGQPFWLRLQAPDKQFGNNRVIELVYTPPTVAELKGTHITDCPFLLVDNAARIVAWNGRDIGSKVVPAAPTGYTITHERLMGEGDDRTITLENITVPGATAWDLRIAPILLALTWKADSAATVRLIDFFGPRHGEALVLSWEGTAVTIAGNQYTITPNQTGHLAALTAADGSKLITIAGRE
jgi:hypothetical protein